MKQTQAVNAWKKKINAELWTHEQSKW